MLENSRSARIDRASLLAAAVGAAVGAPTVLFAVSDSGKRQPLLSRIAGRAFRGAALGCACATALMSIKIYLIR